MFPRKHYFVKQPFVGEVPVRQFHSFRNTDFVGEETREGLWRDAGSIVCLLPKGERSASTQTSEKEEAMSVGNRMEESSKSPARTLKCYIATNNRQIPLAELWHKMTKLQTA